MADVRAFRGITPNESVVGSLGNVLCPPYDVISAEDQASLYDLSAYNMVRLELGMEKPEDDLHDNRYTRAATTLAEWMAAGALLQEAEPALYIYDQSFTYEGQRLTRRGVLALLRLTPWSEGVVLPHEETMAKPKEDRLRLMRATRCNLSPLYLLFQGSGDPRREMDKLTTARPDAEADTGDGLTHRLWVARGEAATGLLGALRETQLFMADGHHRYETALAYRDEQRASGDNPSADAAHDFAMVLLVDAEDPGLVVLPTHRMVRGIDQEREGRLDETLLAQFEAHDLPTGEGTPEERALALLEQMRELGGAAPAIGVYRQGRGAIVLVHRGPAAQVAAVNRPVLDVDVLHSRILEPALGVGPEELKAGSRVSYTRDATEAVEAVDRGDFQVAFLLNPTKVQEVLDTSRAGGKMPQKSTYFYPKPATGLVLNLLRGEG